MAPLVHPDYSEAMENELVAGVYACKLTDAVVKTSRNGQMYVNWKFETVPDKRIGYFITMLEGKASGLFKHLVHCAGDSSYGGGPYNTDRLIGQQIMAKLDVEEYDDQGMKQLRYKVKNIGSVTNANLNKDQENTPNEDDIGF